MINRENWIFVRDFLKNQREVMQRSPKTVKSNWGHLKHLLDWAGERMLTSLATIRPVYPVYLEAVTFDEKRFSTAYLDKNYKTVRQFLKWCKETYPSRFKMAPVSLINTLRASRGRGMQAALHVRKIYTVEEITAVARRGMGYEDLTIKRVAAAAAMLFLSGMRIGAFLTLPIGAVDLGGNQISQLPELGVATKNSKAAITTLLPIAELQAVVREWDALVRPKLPSTAYWYVHLDRGGKINQEKPSLLNRHSMQPNFQKALGRLCTEAGVEYKSPHKIRHGHVVWALKQCKSMDEFKAVSQNVMHSSIQVTDGIYGDLVDDDMQQAIKNLGKGGKKEENLTPEMVREIVKRMMEEKE